MLRAKDPSRVLVYIHNLELGGSQINAIDFAGAIREYGFTSVVVGPRDMRPDGPSVVDIAAEREIPLLQVERQRTTLKAARQLSKIAESTSAGIIHVYNTWSFRQAYWGPCLFARRPLVMTVYEMDVDQTVYQAPPLIVGAGYLAEQSGARRGHVSLISPPVDLAANSPANQDHSTFLRNHGIGENELNIVIVGRLDGGNLRPIKSIGVEYAMQGLRTLARNDVNLIVVGTGNQSGHLNSVAAQVNNALNRRACVMVGPLADPRAAYASADVVIGMGGSAARGLAFGKPLIVQGEFGDFRLFDPSSARRLFFSSFWNEERVADPVDTLVLTLRPLLENHQLRIALGKYGREFAESNFGLHAMTERLVEVYRTAAMQYSHVDWLYDQRLEARWALGWLARSLAPKGSLSDRLSYSQHVARHEAASSLAMTAGRSQPLGERGPQR